MAGIYIHIPFCKQACYYCDFHFSTNQEKRSAMVGAIARELILQKDYIKGPIKTIYFGGGTPSLISKDELNVLFDTIRQYFKIDSDAEITLEANPDDLSAEKLMHLKDAGVNRLSIGIQSFNDNILTFLNRAHRSATALKAVNDARRIGFSNISIDLIFAIPQQDISALQCDISMALEVNPEHISVYSLTVEEKTVFGRWASKGKFRPVDEDLAAKQMELLMELLESAGYEHYEISNFSKPGFQSTHNSNYWKQQPYLGVGPSAHSFNGATRQSNISNNHLYLNSLEERRIPSQIEHLSFEDKVNDYVLTSLRTCWGCDLKKMLNEFNVDLYSHYKPYIDRLIQSQFISLDKNVLKLTRKGRLLADKIASDLFI